MSFLLSALPWWERWLMLLAAGMFLLGVGFLQGDRHRGRVDGVDMQRMRNEWSSERAAAAATAAQQHDRNIELQQAAERNYVVRQQAQDRYFVTTVKEIHDAAAPLASCPVPDAVRVRLNAAAACASSDSPAACGAAGPLPGP